MKTLMKVTLILENLASAVRPIMPITIERSWEVKIGGSRVQGQLWLHRKFVTSLGYMVSNKTKPTSQNPAITKALEPSAPFITSHHNGKHILPEEQGFNRHPTLEFQTPKVRRNKYS